MNATRFSKAAAEYTTIACIVATTIKAWPLNSQDISRFEELFLSTLYKLNPGGQELKEGDVRIFLPATHVQFCR